MLTADRLREIADAAGLAVEGYSGRGMFGRRCLSVIDRSGSAIVTLSLLVRHCTDPHEAADLILGTQQDSFGSGSVVYWPRILDEGAE